MSKRGVDWANSKFLSIIKPLHLAHFTPLCLEVFLLFYHTKVLHPRFQSYSSIAILRM